MTTTARAHLLNLLAPYSASRREAAVIAFEAEVLAAAAGRVGALPTANAGRLIAVTREQILAAITASTALEG